MRNKHVTALGEAWVLVCNIYAEQRSKEETMMSSSDIHQIYVKILHGDFTLPDDEAIENDINRTNLTDGTLKPALRNLLRVAAVFFPQVGYVQGMNYIAAALLLAVRDEVAAFEIFVRLMHVHRLESLYAPGLLWYKQLISQWEGDLASFEPELFKHFRRHGISCEIIGSGWFLTLFTSTTQSKELLELILNQFVNRGWAFIQDLAITALSCVRDLLLTMDFESIMKLIQESSEFMLHLALRTSKGADVFSKLSANRRSRLKMSSRCNSGGARYPRKFKSESEVENVACSIKEDDWRETPCLARRVSQCAA